ncbi:hypothetical protein ACJ72_05303 [Emergomyces africanus]|uniref:Nitrogen regulatory protein areA GATA-like domain-containing protein n=1 Tax=Emergomyces africanus TaxID=1955775 RepID=A0A1B7NUQ5_9EURO|nr:hypothetical protein ACJ72_05303 [Emergomyces africanus]
MTEALPKGIVLHSESISSEIESFGGVDAEDLAKLWRVYTTNRSTMKEDEGRRLENLFWRIWSNRSILRTIQGTTLAGLFIHISEGESITKMGRGRLREISRSIPRIPSRRRPPAQSTASIQPQSFSATASFKSNQSVSRKPSGNAGRTPLPPPILKKPRQTTNGAQQTFGGSTTGATEEYTERSLSLSPSPVAGHEVLSGQSALEKPRRKKTTFATNVTSMEAKPVPLRKKSFQSPSDIAPTRHSPTAAASSRTISASPDLYGPSATPRQQTYPIPDESAISISPTLTSYVKPYPWLGPSILRPGPTSNPTSHPASTIAAKSIHEQQTQQKRSNSSPSSQQAQPSQASLVEKDFRARFVEKRLQESRNSSFTNLGSSLLMQGGDGRGNTSITAALGKLESPGDANPVIGFPAAGSLGKKSVGRGSSLHQHQQPQQQRQHHPSQSNGSKFVHENTAEEDEDEGEWEDVDSDDPANTVSPSSRSPLQPQPQLQSSFRQGIPTLGPSLTGQQSQLSELIERERKLSPTMQQKKGKHVMKNKTRKPEG